MKRFTLCLFLAIAFISPMNCVLAKEKAQKINENTPKVQKINTFDYVNIPFWKNFNDEKLVENLTMIYKNNVDLKASANKVKAAQKLVKISLANEMPHIAFDGYASRTFDSSNEIYGDVIIPNYSETHYLMPLTLNYEIDIWGENRLKTKAQEKRLDVVHEDERAAYVALTSDFAIDYFNLIKVDKLINLQKELINTQRNVCGSLEKRYIIGTATVNEVIFARKNLTYLKEELNDLCEKQDVLKNQMNVFLSNRDFSEVQRQNFDNIKINPVVPEEIEINFLEKRPDWVKAKLELQEIGYDVRIAKKDFLPKFNLAGNLGFNAYNFSSNHTFLSSLGIEPTLDIFDGGRKFQVLKLQKDRYNLAWNNYDKVILTSMQETNDALYALKSIDKKYAISTDRLNLDNMEMRLIKDRNKIGTADALDVLLKKEQVIISNKQASALKIDEIISMINLYKALGGANYINSL